MVNWHATKCLAAYYGGRPFPLPEVPAPLEEAEGIAGRVLLRAAPKKAKDHSLDVVFEGDPEPLLRSADARDDEMAFYVDGGCREVDCDTQCGYGVTGTVPGRTYWIDACGQVVLDETRQDFFALLIEPQVLPDFTVAA